MKDLGSELYGAEIIVFNQALANSWLVGGADFDCVIKSKSGLTLTDIKTKTRPITIEHLRQLIGYALLHDENKDDFKFTHIGIYHARSGSFRHLPIETVIKTTLAGFESVGQAKEAFIAALKRPTTRPQARQP